MSEMAPEPGPKSASTPLEVTQDLAAIIKLHDHLLAQAVIDSTHPLMPGGSAMAELAPVANIEAWGHHQQADERLGTHHTAPDLEDPERAWTAYQTVKYWAEEWRRMRDAEYEGSKTTLATEVNFLRWSLEWAWDHEGRWAAMADDIKGARRRLENILTDGHRDIISEDVACLMCGTNLRRRMTARGGFEDEWWCRECRVHLSTPQFNLAASEAAREAFQLDA